ncbi:hypothetical protein BY458DRAFT_500579 [Sporodiniella umbellata]|nr:hypothetical protein BY458DRAFT_500579 [Sporodiniella umbellata]
MKLFWRTFQSNFKREELESEETLDSRIRDAFHDICLNSFESFFAYSEEKFKNCFDQTHQ